MDAATKWGWTALHEVAYHGRTAIGKVLLDSGASVDHTSDRDVTPLMRAASRGHLAFMRLLVSRGAKWWHNTGRNSNAFVMACDSGNIAYTSYLLGLGNDINKITVGGYTPLHYAARANRREMVRFLLELGADRTAAATETRYPFGTAIGTPAEIAKAFGAKEVVEMIENWESDMDELDNS